MGAHIFLVSEDNYEICVKLGVYGCVMPSTERNKSEVIASVLAIKPEDIVFFYVKNKGVHGLWKVEGEPYFDDTKIWPDEQRLFPYRISFMPIVGYFPKPVGLSDILDLHDKGRVWTFDLNPVQQKNQYKITMDEARELLRLLLRNNPFFQSPVAIHNPYMPQKRQKIDIELNSQGERVRYEGWLSAWFMKSLAKGELKETLGDYHEFLNLVPTSFNKVMDIFLTHITTINSIEITYKYTCIELKTDLATEKDLSQILRYEDWLSRKLAAGDKEMIQSILVAHRFSEGVIDYIKKRQLIEEKTVRLLCYRIKENKLDIELQEIK